MAHEHEDAAGSTGDSESGKDDAYQLKLAGFEGPLDLLLHLIRKNEMDIFDIPIVEITRQYNTYLEMMQELDLEIAADYVYTAALLIHIKSKMLLPKPPVEDGQPQEDPRRELVERLLEYQKFRAAAESLHEIEVMRAGVWARPEAELALAPGGETDLVEVSLFDLIDAFRVVLDRYRDAHPSGLEVPRPRFSVREKILELWDELTRSQPLELLGYLEGLQSRTEMVAVFLAVLELVRLRYVRVFQRQLFAEPLLYKAREEMRIEEFGDIEADVAPDDGAEGTGDTEPDGTENADTEKDQ